MIASTRTAGVGSAADASFADRLRHYQLLTREALRRRLSPKEPRRHLYDLVNASLEGGAGGLGPALCLATCGALGGRADDAADSAAAIEMLHHAFAVHEDLDCDGTGSAGHPLHRDSGVPLALNAGDAMQALSMRIMRHNFARLPEPVAWRIVDEFDHMLVQALEGRAMEIGWAERTAGDPSEAGYLRTVLKRTCWSGFIHPCRIGALIARPEHESLEPFAEFGYYLGAAWRIQTEIAELILSRGLRVGDPGRARQCGPEPRHDPPPAAGVALRSHACARAAAAAAAPPSLPRPGLAARSLRAAWQRGLRVGTRPRAGACGRRRARARLRRRAVERGSALSGRLYRSGGRRAGVVATEM